MKSKLLKRACIAGIVMSITSVYAYTATEAGTSSDDVDVVEHTPSEFVGNLNGSWGDGSGITMLDGALEEMETNLGEVKTAFARMEDLMNEETTLTEEISKLELERKHFVFQMLQRQKMLKTERKKLSGDTVRESEITQELADIKQKMKSIKTDAQRKGKTLTKRLVKVRIENKNQRIDVAMKALEAGLDLDSFDNDMDIEEEEVQELKDFIEHMERKVKIERFLVQKHKDMATGSVPRVGTEIIKKITEMRMAYKPKLYNERQLKIMDMEYKHLKAFWERLSWMNTCSVKFTSKSVLYDFEDSAVQTAISKLGAADSVKDLDIKSLNTLYNGFTDHITNGKFDVDPKSTEGIEMSKDDLKAYTELIRRLEDCKSTITAHG